MNTSRIVVSYIPLARLHYVVHMFIIIIVFMVFNVTYCLELHIAMTFFFFM